jgi:hypothetical protein
MQQDEIRPASELPAQNDHCRPELIKRGLMQR